MNDMVLSDLLLQLMPGLLVDRRFHFLDKNSTKISAFRQNGELVQFYRFRDCLRAFSFLRR